MAPSGLRGKTERIRELASLTPSRFLTLQDSRDTVFGQKGLGVGRTLSSPSSTCVTELLARWSAGDAAAREAVIAVVYQELRRLAGRCLAGQQHQTLQSTALVHEAYLRLAGQSSLRAESRAHFFAIAARLMREILVDHARSRGAAKRGASCLTLSFDEAVALPRKPRIDLVALDDALNQLSVMDARQSQIVDLRFFGGLSIEDTSSVLGVSPATVKREWSSARMWLQRELRRGAAHDS